MKVLITGGAGFIGYHTVDLMINNGYQVIIVDNLCSGRNIHNQAQFYQLDICSPKLSEIFSKEKPNYVIHLAAQVSVQNSLHFPETDAVNNIQGTINLLKNCVEHKARKIVYSSSAAVYGEPREFKIDEYHSTIPLSFYGLSKLTAEHYIRLYGKYHGLNYTILRYSNVYGRNQKPYGEGGVISIFIDNVLQNVPPIIYGSGQQTRDFIYVEDVAKANAHALNTENYEIFNISSNTSTSINELLTMISDIIDQNPIPIHKPQNEDEIQHSLLNNNKAKLLLGWKPNYTLYQGLLQTVKYILETRVGVL